MKSNNLTNNYLRNYIYIKNRPKLCRYKLAEALQISVSAVISIRSDVKNKYLERKDAAKIENSKFENVREPNPKNYWESEDELFKSDFEWIHQLNFQDLSDDEKEIYIKMNLNEIEVEPILIFDKKQIA